jgi:regulator of sigma E protease
VYERTRDHQVAAVGLRRAGRDDGEVHGKRFKGADYFVWAMAVISINLGLFNLLPIPVLDGGHLFFLAVEGLIRRRLPLRVRELSHLVGMAILLALMVLAFKNDLEKRWDAITGHSDEMAGG